MQKFKVQENQLGSIMGKEEITAAISVLKSGKGLSFASENLVKFEQEFAEYCGVKHAIALSSCTAALRIATQILRIGKKDEVVATPQTFKATLLAVAERGATVRFADIDPNTINIDPATIEDKITSKTKAIYVTHMCGNPVDMDPILEIARRYNIAVVEDAAHAPGAEYRGRKVGNLGDLTCFSFHSLKNITTGGEGGMITTNNDQYDNEARAFRQMGIFGDLREKSLKAIGPYFEPQPPLSDHSAGAYSHQFTHIEEWGTNFRMSELQAAIGRTQLRKLDSLNEKRAQIAACYTKGLSGIRGYRLWQITPGAKCVYHLYPTFIDRHVIKANQVKVIRYLEDVKGVHIVLRFWPVHLSKYMQFQGHHFGECPVCEKVWFEEQLNLPICASMSDEEVDYVVNAMKETAKHFT